MVKEKLANENFKNLKFLKPSSDDTRQISKYIFMYARVRSQLYWRNDTLLLFSMTVGRFTCSSILKIYNFVPLLLARQSTAKTIPSKIRRAVALYVRFSCIVGAELFWSNMLISIRTIQLVPSPVFPALPWIIAEALKKTVRTSSKRLRFRL